MKYHIRKFLVTILITNLFFSVIQLSSPAEGADTSITFWNMQMIRDNVKNYEGIRIVVFFLPFCGHCIDELDVLKKIENDYSVTIFELDISKEETNQTLIEFKKNHTIPDSWVLGYSTDESENFFDIYGVPTLIILDDLGRIVFVAAGFINYNTLETKIDDAINHRTENYSTDYGSNTNQLKALFIIIGVGVGVIVIYFLIKSLLPE